MADPYRAEGCDVIFQALHGGSVESEHVIARGDDPMWAVHIADALNLKARYMRGELF
ncbi:hypothetical protein [Mycobacterium intracellulare]|uniref:hypothetical protein n=1 Tax=Mycobacterium intracellulare TaxID=1767 RepID=UPI0019278280|nr:hypothetical protein [Mycobacterium intracellulare]